MPTYAVIVIVTLRKTPTIVITFDNNVLDDDFGKRCVCFQNENIFEKKVSHFGWTTT